MPVVFTFSVAVAQINKYFPILWPKKFFTRQFFTYFSVDIFSHFNGPSFFTFSVDFSHLTEFSHLA